MLDLYHDRDLTFDQLYLLSSRESSIHPTLLHSREIWLTLPSDFALRNTVPTMLEVSALIRSRLDHLFAVVPRHSWNHHHHCTFPLVIHHPLYKTLVGCHTTTPERLRVIREY
jgi:hypothetical protein